MNIEEAYNNWSAQYDSNLNKTRDLDQHATKEMLSKRSFRKVLELGCGTGKNTAFLLTKAEGIVGLDFSREMLSIARKKIKDHRVAFKKSDLKEHWPVKDGQFDLITASLTLEHIEDLSHIFQQARRKLIKGGLFFISELHPFKQYLGSGAKFESKTGTIELEVFTHHFSDFTENARHMGFDLLELREWFDESNRSGVPRLISFVFRKK